MENELRQKALDFISSKEWFESDKFVIQFNWRLLREFETMGFVQSNFNRYWTVTELGMNYVKELR